MGGYAAAAGAVVSAAGTIMGGNAQRAAGNFQKTQADANARTVRATTQRNVVQADHEADLLTSKLKAGAAAGGSGGDVGVTDLLGDLQTKKDYNAMNIMFNGEQEATGQELQGEAASWAGTNARKASMIGAAGQTISGMGSAFSRYNDDELLSALRAKGAGAGAKPA